LRYDIKDGELVIGRGLDNGTFSKDADGRVANAIQALYVLQAHKKQRKMQWIRIKKSTVRDSIKLSVEERRKEKRKGKSARKWDSEPVGMSFSRL
jgi:hypothetical protein